MDEDEDDLYAVAMELPSTSSDRPGKNIQHTAPLNSSSNPDYASLFRQILVGSRSQISKLRAENESLQKNLANALKSGGVVVCPNCTHHFNDRQCLLRPRAMKKMRARNCVELEFSTEEDLTTWLYLNQLETNNDGLPTIMKVIKTAPAKESLRDVGSILPELVEKKKNEERKKEEKKKIVEVMKRSPIKLKIIKEKIEKNEKAVDVVVNRRHSGGRDAMRKEELDKGKQEKKKKENEKPVEKEKKEAPKRKMDKVEEPERCAKTPRKEAKEPRKSVDSKKSLSERLSFPKTSGTTLKTPTLPPPITSKKSQIVWDSPERHAAEPTETTPRTQQPAFKIPPTKTAPPKVSPVSLLISKPKSKISFIPTAQKKVLAQKDSENEVKIDSSPIAPLPTVTVPVEIEKTAVPVNLTLELEHAAFQPDKVQLTETKAIELSWLILPIRMPATFLENKKRTAENRREVLENFRKKKIVETKENHLQSFQKEEEDVQNVAEKPATEEPVWDKAKHWKALNISEACIAQIKRMDRFKKLARQDADNNDNISSEHQAPISSGSVDKCSPIEEPKQDAAPAPEQPLVFEPSPPQNSRPSVQLEQEDHDILEEFFPAITNYVTSIPSSTSSTDHLTHRSNSQTDIESENVSICSLEDREEQELMDIATENSNDAPGRNVFLGPEEEVDKTITGEDEPETGDADLDNSDYRDFCLEDVDDFRDEDETIRERRLSESSEVSETFSRKSEEDMQWMDEEDVDPEDNLENLEEYIGENLYEEIDLAEPERVPSPRNHSDDVEPVPSESNHLEPESGSRGPESEDLISPMTSTPKKNDVEDGKSDDDEEIFRPISRQESFVVELDWDYGIEGFDDDEEAEQAEQNEETIRENGGEHEKEAEVQDDVEVGAEPEEINEVREDGELSDDEEKATEKPKESTTKRPMRERIRYVVDQKQVAIEDNDSDSEDGYGPYKTRENHQKPRRISQTRRRSSEENRYHREGNR